MQVDKESQFKVDNWGTFFLHRLFLLYEKGEKCDGTLIFKSGQSIKVHKLVLSTCTDYFDESVWRNDSFTLPPLLTHGAVLPIINFMYTGFLNCSAELNHAVFTAAKYFNVTVLIKLMHAQMGGDVNPPKPSTDLANTSTPTKSDESTSAAPSTPTPSPAPSPSPAETPASVIKLKKLPNSAKTLFVTPQPSTSSSVSVAATASTSQLVPGKKLPFWKKRTTTAGGAGSGAGAGSPVAGGGSRLKQGGTPPPVVASPCRFEADRVAVTSDDKAGFQPHTECSSFSGINYIDEPVYKTSSSPKPIHQLTTEFNNLNRKRSHDRVQCDEIEDIDEDDVDGDLTCAETVVMVAKGGASAEDKFDRLTKMATTPKPILKPLTSESVTAGVVGSNSKKVRFSLVAEGKENTESANSVTPAASPALGGPAPSPSKPVVGGAKEPVAMATAYQRVLISGDKSANLNASQIISEVMKKNPNLMKNNKNFRVLVSGAGKKAENGGGGGGETKLKLIVMKPQTQKSQPTAAAVKGSASNAENTTGPWLCNDCGVAGQPMCFETYYLYRRHLHDVHQQRIDARICEYCGYKSSKRNLHLYHLYTKHDVPPPRNIRFPKCDKCNYIALSDSLLIKHNNNHATSSEKLSCKPCKVAFRSQAALQAHNQTCAHSKDAPPGAVASPTKEYSCQYCSKTFNRSINLKAHMRIAHNNESRSMYEEEEEEGVSAGAGDNDDECSSSTANLLQVIRLPMVEGVGMDDGEEGGQRTLLLPAGVFLTGGGGGGGEGGECTPSSEQEAMSTVASGIATSINLNDASHLMAGDQTVILLDGSSELVLSNTVMLTTPPDGSTSTASNACAGEYIVPEVMSTTNQLFQTVTMSSSVEGGLPEGASIIVVPPDNHMIVDQDSAAEQTTEEQQSSSEPITTSHQHSNATASTEDDKCTNIVEEACKRSTIIIETSSVVPGAQKSDSVIVSAQTPRIDLSDWDDMDTSNGRCDNPDERPVRVTLERMPDII